MKKTRRAACPRPPGAALVRVPAVPRRINPRRGGVLCSVGVEAADPALRARLWRDVPEYFATSRCAVEGGPDVCWHAVGAGQFVTQSLVAPRFVRAAARLLLCTIARELARVYGVDEGAFGVLCAFVEVQSAATIGGRAVGPNLDNEHRV